MKIISKFKDYYDFIIQDPDSKKIYPRYLEEITDNFTLFNKKFLYEFIPKNNEKLISLVEDRAYCFGVAFCGKIYQGIYFKPLDEFYYSNEQVSEEFINFVERGNSTYYKDIFYILKKSFIDKKYNLFKPQPTKINKHFESPLVYIPPKYGFFNSEKRSNFYTRPYKNIKLSNIDFHKLFPPKEAYIEIYNYIEYPEPKIPSNPEDMDRFQSKGFDKKSSFRNIKK